MSMLRICLSLFIVFSLNACMPKFNRGYYDNAQKLKDIAALSVVMSDKNLTEFIRLNDHLIIINGIVINTVNNTYGIPPEDGGFLQSYEDRASSKTFTDWADLTSLEADKTIPPKSEIDHLFELMSKFGFSEYNYDSQFDVHAFLSESYVLKGFYGILLGDADGAMSVSKRENYDYVSKLKTGVYYFEFR